MRHSVFIAALCASVLMPSAAFAQAASVEASAGDNGVKLGEGRLHPYANAETHYVVNPGRVNGNTDGDGYLTTRAGLDYELGSPTLSLKFTGEGSYNLYFTSEDLSGFNAKVETDIEGLKGRPFEYRLKAGYIRTQMPPNQAFTGTVDHNDFTGAAGFTVRPGGGALSLSGDFTTFYQDYDENQNNFASLGPNPKNFNQLRMSPQLRAGWKFLPKTSFFVDGRVDITRYPADSGDPPANPDSNNLAIYAGLSGALTTRLSVEAKFGYIDPQTDGVNSTSFGVPVGGEASVGYFISSTSQFRAGIGRTASPQPVFGFSTENKAFVSFDQQIGKVQLSIAGNVGRYSYGVQQGQADPNQNRADNAINATFALTYPVTDWLTLGLSESFEYRTSNSDEIEFVGSAAPPFNFGYTFNDLWLTLNFRY